MQPKAILVPPPGTVVASYMRPSQGLDNTTFVRSLSAHHAAVLARLHVCLPVVVRQEGQGRPKEMQRCASAPVRDSCERGRILRQKTLSIRIVTP